MIQKISAEDLKKMQDREGLVLQGCGGDLREWEDGCCFSKRMRKVFRKNEKNMLQNCNKKAKRKGRLQRVKKPM